MSKKITISKESLVGKGVLSGISFSRLPSDEYDYHQKGKECCIFTLNGINLAAVEDPDDGYRSYCDELVVSSISPDYSFEPQPVIVKHLTKNDKYNNGSYFAGCDFLDLIDPITKLVILRIGTDNTEDYYPYCVMDYHPENMQINQKKESETKPRQLVCFE